MRHQAEMWSNATLLFAPLSHAEMEQFVHNMKIAGLGSATAHLVLLELSAKHLYVQLIPADMEELV